MVVKLDISRNVNNSTNQLQNSEMNDGVVWLLFAWY